MRRANNLLVGVPSIGDPIPTSDYRTIEFASSLSAAAAAAAEAAVGQRCAAIRPISLYNHYMYIL